MIDTVMSKPNNPHQGMYAKNSTSSPKIDMIKAKRIIQMIGTNYKSWYEYLECHKQIYMNKPIRTNSKEMKIEAKSLLVEILRAHVDPFSTVTLRIVIKTFTPIKYIVDLVSMLI